VKHNERSDRLHCTFRKDNVGSRARVTTDEERVLHARKLNRDDVMKVRRLGSCENVVDK